MNQLMLQVDDGPFWHTIDMRTQTRMHELWLRCNSIYLLKSYAYFTFAIWKQYIQMILIKVHLLFDDIAILPSVFVQTFPGLVTPSVVLFPFMRRSIVLLYKYQWMQYLEYFPWAIDFMLDNSQYIFCTYSAYFCRIQLHYLLLILVS